MAGLEHLKKYKQFDATVCILRTLFVVDSWHTEVQNAWTICTWDAYEKHVWMWVTYEM